MAAGRGAIWVERVTVALILICLVGVFWVVVRVRSDWRARRQGPAVHSHGEQATVLASSVKPAAKPAKPAVVKPGPKPSPPAPVQPVEDPTERAVKGLASQAVKEREAAAQADARAAALEKARLAAVADTDAWKRRLMLVHTQVAALGQRAQKLEASVTELDAERDVLEKERDALKAALAQAKHRSGYAVLPYKGPNGTWRRPIVIDCSQGGARLLPSGETFSTLDLSPRIHPRSSPIVLAVARNLFHIQTSETPDGAPVTPYLVFLVRPTGIRPYYEARTSLEPLGIAFGYELIEQDLVVDVPNLDDLSTWDGSAPLELPMEAVSRQQPGGRGDATGPGLSSAAVLAAGSTSGGQVGGASSGGADESPDTFVWPSHARALGQDRKEGDAWAQVLKPETTAGGAGSSSSLRGAGLPGGGDIAGGWNEGLNAAGGFSAGAGSAAGGGAGGLFGGSAAPGSQMGQGRAYPGGARPPAGSSAPDATGSGGTGYPSSNIPPPRSLASLGAQGLDGLPDLEPAGSADSGTNLGSTRQPQAAPGPDRSPDGNTPPGPMAQGAGANSETGPAATRTMSKTDSGPASAGRLGSGFGSFANSGSSSPNTGSARVAAASGSTSSNLEDVGPPLDPSSISAENAAAPENAASSGGGSRSSALGGSSAAPDGSHSASWLDPLMRPSQAAGDGSSSPTSSAGIALGAVDSSASATGSAGGAGSPGAGEPNDQWPIPHFTPRQEKDKGVDVPFEITVVCREGSILLHPGGYILTSKTLNTRSEGDDGALARQLRMIVRKRALADPLIHLKPSLKYIVETRGGPLFWEARKQLLFALPDWPSTLKVAGPQDRPLFEPEVHR